MVNSEGRYTSHHRFGDNVCAVVHAANTNFQDSSINLGNLRLILWVE